MRKAVSLTSGHTEEGFYISFGFSFGSREKVYTYINSYVIPCIIVVISTLDIWYHSFTGLPRFL